MLTVSTELLSVNRGAIEAQSFEIPGGYKKSEDK